MEGLAAISGFFFFCFFVLSIIVLVVFFVMASNIGSIVRMLRRMESNSMAIKNALEKMNSQAVPNTMSESDKARAYDRSQTKM
jgi:hypothetical protein